MSAWWALAWAAYGFVAGGVLAAAAVAIHHQRRAERVQRAIAEAGLR